jgi:hypothetical protein
MHRRSVPFHAVFAAAVAFSVIAAGCSSSAATQGLQGATVAPVAPGVSSQPVASVPVQPVSGAGSCKVTISGGLTASWDTQQTKASAVVSYWLSPAAHQVLSATGESFLMSCDGADGAISLYTTNTTTSVQFPEAAGNYVIGGLGTVSTPGLVIAIVAPKGTNLWNITEPGTFNVTTLNGSKFEGTFQIKIAEQGPDLKLTGKTATVSGTFNLACSANSANVCK